MFRVAFIVFICLIFFILGTVCMRSTPCQISEETVTILTYPYGHSNAAPVLISDPRLYPYSTFLEYSTDGIEMEWKVVKLENEFISVYVLPGVGGKVWFAEVIQNERTFIYKNDVLKFRGIALRGPWVSGGVEFNFGIVGHAPSTASQVNYRLMKIDEDGSVSVVVGDMDLPSRTTWRVEIKLEPGKSKFETRSTWINPSPIRQPYYSWMNSAHKTEDDLKMCYEGTKYLGHDGSDFPWPIDNQGRDLSIYKDNNFGGSHSYHVVGELVNFFGAYYQDKGEGFGHYSDYEHMPGKKAFLWSLSDAGKIWEYLLTDTNGQYMEMQSGREFIQFIPQSGHVNPIKKVFFDPHVTDKWVDIWAPIENIGGISTMSSKGAMYVEKSDDNVEIGLCTFESVKSAKLEVKQTDGTIIYTKTFDLDPLQVFKDTIIIVEGSSEVEVSIDVLELVWSDVSSESLDLDRPFETDSSFWQSIPSYEKNIITGRDYMAGRYFEEAIDEFEVVLTEYPWNKDALTYRAELYFRSGEFSKGLGLTNKLLQMDTYNHESNYLAGILYKASGKLVDAVDCLGFSSRSPLFRSSSYAHLAEISVLKGTRFYSEAIEYANMSLMSDELNIAALQTLSIATRESGDLTLAESTLKKILSIDPLSHFTLYENYLLSPSQTKLDEFIASIICEYPEQVYLELALNYRNHGFLERAVELLDLGAEHTSQNTLLELWSSYLLHSSNRVVESDVRLRRLIKKIKYTQEPLLPTPYRSETIEMLQWTVDKDPSTWLWKYMLALTYWANQRTYESSQIFESLNNTPDSAPFYIARSYLLNKLYSADQEKDLELAVHFGASDWYNWISLISYYQQNNKYKEALNISSEAYAKFESIPDVALSHVDNLIHESRPGEAIRIMESTIVLPTENNDASRSLWEWAVAYESYLLIRNESWSESISALALGYTWPYNVGVGRPYFPDARMFDFLMGVSSMGMNQSKDEEFYYNRIVNFTFTYSVSGESSSYSGVRSMEDYYAYIILKEYFGEAQLAEELISEIEKESSWDVYKEWVVACSKQDNWKIEDLKKKYPSIFDGFAYRLFEDTLWLVVDGRRGEESQIICDYF